MVQALLGGIRGAFDHGDDGQYAIQPFRLTWNF